MKAFDSSAYKNAKTETELSSLSNQLLGSFFDEKQKLDWAKKIESDFGIRRKLESDEKKHKSRSLIWLAIAAALLIPILFMLPFFNKTLSADQIVSKELANPVAYFGTRKGVAEAEELREKAYASYQEKKYSIAIKHFIALDQTGKMKSEDLLFMALANLYQGNYTKAINQFEEENIREKYPERSEWYSILAYYELRENDKAVQLLQKYLNNSEDKFKEDTARELLKALSLD